MLKRIAVFLIIFTMLISCVYADLDSNVNKKESYAKIKVVDSVSRDIISDVVIKATPIENKSKTLKLEYKGQDLFVKNLELGRYDWTVKSKGYKIAKYYNYPIVSGGNVYVFELSKESSIKKDYNETIKKRNRSMEF